MRRKLPRHKDYGIMGEFKLKTCFVFGTLPCTSHILSFFVGNSPDFMWCHNYSSRDVCRFQFLHAIRIFAIRYDKLSSGASDWSIRLVWRHAQETCQCTNMSSVCKIVTGLRTLLTSNRKLKTIPRIDSQKTRLLFGNIELSKGISCFIHRFC